MLTKVKETLHEAAEHLHLGSKPHGDDGKKEPEKKEDATPAKPEAAPVYPPAVPDPGAPHVVFPAKPA